MSETLAFIIFPGFQLLDLSGPVEVFSSANPERGEPRYEVRVLAERAGLVASSSGLALQAEALPEPQSLVGASLLVVGGPGVQVALQQGRVAGWLRDTAPLARRCASVCTGAFLLAQAGLLDERRALTHWRFAPLLQRLFPRVRVLQDGLYVEDEGVHSCAGVSAGIDLALALLEADHGRELALQVAKGLVLPLRRSGGQRQFSAELLAQRAREGGLVERLGRWLDERLEQPLDIETMAAAMAVSARSLHRHCQTELGLSPAVWLQQKRLQAACRQLEEGAASLKRVVWQCGFGSEYNLRRAFVLRLGVTPAEYRRSFSRGDDRGRS